MQYVGQTSRFLFKKARFSEHYRRMKKTREIDKFLYRHFKLTNHSPSHISIPQEQKILYDDNSTKRYRRIRIKMNKTITNPHPLGFNDNILNYQRNIDTFYLLQTRK